MEENYYEQLISKIDTCMQRGNYESARQLVDDELKMPYVPKAVLEKLTEYKEQLDILLLKEKPLTVIAPEELEGMLKGTSQQAMSAISSLRSANVRNYLDQIRRCLKNSDIHHLIKSMVLEVMIEQKVDEEFAFERDGRIMNVVPSLMTKAADQPLFNELMTALERLLAKNPSFLQQSQILALNLAYDLFPGFLEKEKIPVYTYSIIRYLYRCYDENEQWKQFAASQDVDEDGLMELSF